VHNLNRCYRDGRSSFADVLKNLRLAIEKLGSIQVNAVYGPKTFEYLPETFSFFRKLGIKIIHFNPDISTDWNESAWSKLSDTYLKITNKFIKSYERKQETAINSFDSKIITFLKGGYGDRDRCGMGEAE